MTEKKTIIISGVGPTFQIAPRLEKYYKVAFFDRNNAQHYSVLHDREVLCPMGGAQQALFERARNDAAIATAGTVGLSIDGLNATRWLPGLTVAHLNDVAIHLRTLEAFSKSDDVDVAAVIVHEDVTTNFRALALWGKTLGVPVIHIPHNNCYMQTRPDIHDESVADWILASSVHMRNWYVERGFPKDRIKIVGFPSWDKWADKPISRARARAILQFDERPLVCLCTGWTQRTNAMDDHEMQRAAVHLALSAARREGWQLMWKIHPGDAQGKEQEYAKLAAAYRVPAGVTRDHLSIALRASDAVLSVGPSNVLVEAGLCDVPPALFDFRGYDFGTTPPWSVEDLTEDGVTETLERAREGWTDKARARFVRRYAFKNDGKSSKRAVRAIKRIING